MSKIDQLDAALTMFELALTDKLLHPHPEASARFVNARGELFLLFSSHEYSPANQRVVDGVDNAHMLPFELTEHDQPRARFYAGITDAQLLDAVVGLLPSLLSADDPRPAHEQIDTAYAYGGGWSDFHGFKGTELPNHDLVVAVSRRPKVFPASQGTSA